MGDPPVIGILCDGLRPDSVREAWMPNLCAMARAGVRFLRHRSVFPTSTRVCVSSLGTGVHPRKHGLPGNALFAREMRPPRPISTGAAEDLDAWSRALGGRLLLRRNIFQRLGRRRGGAVVSVASSGSARLWTSAGGAALFHPEIPAGLGPDAEEALGPLPAAEIPALARCRYALRLAAEVVLPRLRPRLLIVHLSEPDSTQHAAGVGGRLHRRTLRGLDRLIGEFAEGLERAAPGGRANLLVFSDHGAASVIERVDIEAELRAAGLKGMGRAWAVAHSEGAALFYARGEDMRPLLPVAEFLRTRPWAGPLFSRDGRGAEGRIPGSFSLRLAGCGGPRGPDLLMPFGWEGKGAGRAYSSVKNKGAGGTHGSCSPFELHNTLIARGPAFRRGAEVDRPSGNVDIAPTLLALCGLPPPGAGPGPGARGGGLDGRPLWEGLRGRRAPAGKIAEETFRVEGRSGAGAYLQTLRRTRAGERFFLDFAQIERG